MIGTRYLVSESLASGPFTEGGSIAYHGYGSGGTSLRLRSGQQSLWQLGVRPRLKVRSGAAAARRGRGVGRAENVSDSVAGRELEPSESRHGSGSIAGPGAARGGSTGRARAAWAVGRGNLERPFKFGSAGAPP